VTLVLPKIISNRTIAIQFLLVIACFAFYFGSGEMIVALRNGVLNKQFSGFHLAMHWTSDISLVLLFVKGIQVLRQNFAALKSSVGYLGWIFSIALVYIVSFECMQLYVTIFAETKTIGNIEQQYSKAGLTILWGLSSFVMIWLGMKHRYKPLRVISLCLFAVSLLKLFLFDITNIGPGGKIAAFILLGILLLTVSFMYQRLKKLLIDDTDK
jgi:uncharacterized membrane protein